MQGLQYFSVAVSVACAPNPFADQLYCKTITADKRLYYLAELFGRFGAVGFCGVCVALCVGVNVLIVSFALILSACFP
mgnify:CR=1 FL=1